MSTTWSSANNIGDLFVSRDPGEEPMSSAMPEPALDFEDTEYGIPTTRPADPSTKRFLRIEDVWM